MGWKIVEINTNEYVQLYLNNLLIKRNNEKIILNIRDIDTVIFNNLYSTISVKLLNELVKNNVNIIMMNEKHEPSSFTIPINGHHYSLKIFNEQLKWTKKYKALLWQEIVKNKIYNQFKLLKNNNLFEGKYFFDLVNNVNLFDITNREGHAAKVYWNLQYSTKFIRNNKIIDQFSLINTMLNYGYSILRSAIIRSIIKKGLDPRISIFHKSFSNFFALASDLMEPLRPLVDEIVFQNKNLNIFDIKIKDELINVLNKRVRYKNRHFFVNDVCDQIVDNLVNKKSWEWIELWD